MILLFILLAIATLLAVVGIGWNLWCLRCNVVAYDQMEWLLALIKRHYAETGDYEETIRMFDDMDAVSYDQHLKAVCWRKDPKLLYSERLQKLLEG